MPALATMQSRSTFAVYSATFLRRVMPALLLLPLALWAVGCGSSEPQTVTDDSAVESFQAELPDELSPAMVNRLDDMIISYRELLSQRGDQSERQASAQRMQIETLCVNWRSLLLKSLGESDWEARRVSAVGLGFIRNPEWTEEHIGLLLGVLQGDEDMPASHYFALQGLAELGDKSDILREYTQRNALLFSLARFAQHSNDDLRGPAIDALGRALNPGENAQVYNALVFQLSHENEPTLRDNLIVALATVGTPEAMQVVSLQGLSDADAGVRNDAVVCLGQTRNPMYASDLLGALGDPVPHVRMQAIAMLKGYRQNAELRSRIVRSVAALLRDVNADVRAQAAQALGVFGDASIVPDLILKLADRRTEVRSEAIASLGQLRDERAIEPLVQTMADREESIRRNCQTALGLITGVDWGTDPSAWQEWVDQGMPPVDEAHYSDLPGAAETRRVLYTRMTAEGEAGDDEEEEIDDGALIIPGNN